MCSLIWVLWHFTKKELRGINRKINLVSRGIADECQSQESNSLSRGPAQGSRVEGKTAWGNHLSHQLQIPFLFTYIPLLSILARRLPKLHIFYKACFPETPVSHCPSSCHLCQNHYCKKRDRRSPTVYSEGRSKRPKEAFSGNFVVGIFCYFFGG